MHGYIFYRNIAQFTDDFRVLMPEVERNYPGLFAHVIFINCPMVVDVLSRLFSRVVGSYTKIHVNGIPNTRKELHRMVSSENLPACYGGSRSDYIQTYERSLQFPRPTPDEFVWHDMVDVRKPPGELTTIRISPRSHIMIPIPGTKQGDKIRYWLSANGCVDFAILSGDALRTPKFTLDATAIPEYGDIECDGGDYAMYIGSSWNLIYSLKVSYFYAINL